MAPDTAANEKQSPAEPDETPRRAPADGPQVFYRRWRPQRFGQLAGQQPVAQTLRRAVATGRTAHAYLFCGPRGVGKTSTARILAKALNCLDPEDGEPDNACENCVAVNEGRMMDLIEIDAASNRGIDDIRNLREKTQFAPSTARYKVYIIDEVHMLTVPAFNALLKTLEEPPPHTVMVLATTEVHRVLPTIISRCQRFDFRRIPTDVVVERLAEMCRAEDIKYEPEVLEIIARAAWGSLRDAQNSLEQLAVSYGSSTGGAGRNGGITAAHARELLGLGDTSTAVALASALLKGDAAEALRIVNSEAERGAELSSLRTGAIDALRAALLIRAGAADALSHPEEVVRAMRAAAPAATLERLLRALTALGEAQLRREGSTALGLEMAVLRACTEPPQPPAAAQPAAGPAQASRAYGGTASRPARPTAAGETSPPEPSEDRTPSRELTPAQQRWNQVIDALRRTRGKRFFLGALLRNVETPRPENGAIVLGFRSKSLQENFEEELRDPRVRQAVEQAVRDAYGTDLELRFENAAQSTANRNANAAMESPLVRSAMAMGARVIDSEERPAT